MSYKGTKRINENAFKNLKAVIAAQGVTATQADTGYSLRTIKSIKSAKDYETWRAKRKRTASKSEASSPAVAKPDQAPTAKELPQAPTTREFKRPGHAFNPASRRDEPSVADRAAHTVTTDIAELQTKLESLDSNVLSVSRKQEKLEDRVQTLEGDNQALDLSWFDRGQDDRPWWRKLMDKIGGRL
ncbi:hypothetical protein [Dietzia sp. MNB45]|uniref:hypothetical protein n=1 Tax=Dietzia sp. MNB45 TaxID=3238800 RepID=UPI003F7CDF19